MDEFADRDVDVDQPSRRNFLKGSTAAIGGGIVGVAGLATAAQAQQANNLPPNVPEWMTYPGDDTAHNPYGLPSPYEEHVVRKVLGTPKTYSAASSRTPLQDLDGIITPNGLHYERHHGGIPEIDPAQHRLMIFGLVDRPLVFTMDDLKRFPSVSRIHMMECSGNQSFTATGRNTAQELMGLVSCAEWTGVALKTVLEECGVQSNARWVVAEGADAAAMTRSIPLEKCLDDVILAYSQNGERIRPEQGYPLRIFVPGYEGNMSVKWLRSLQVREEPIYSREETSKYTDLLPDGHSRQFSFMMEAKSIITYPSGGQQLSAQGYHEISGLAWSGYGKIERVEVSVDGGETWQEAQLQDPVLPICLTRFRLPWAWEGEPVTIMSRAIDETGYVQPTLEALLDARGRNSVYHNHAIQPWAIAANGEVSNANA
ncbi:sulfite dehydrogenase [Pararhodobacter zhoushanensis]|uniref:sulfite dehydrogenase n=1 Tax=Pararhodobacter zhoushanensis TaxID=2479545 RepID=UPI000F8F3ECD|nr:sulfite dehydrogenase [Pararhodobacter zhoushanensis]